MAPEPDSEGLESIVHGPYVSAMAEIEVVVEELESLVSRHLAIADAYAVLSGIGVMSGGSWGETVTALDRLQARMRHLLADLAVAHREVAAALEAGARRYDHSSARDPIRRR